MEKKVCVVLADGFEEIEGLTVVDLLRRAGIQVTTASIMQSTAVTGSHAIALKADAMLSDVDASSLDMLVLPGGMPGTKHLQESALVKDALKTVYGKGSTIAAICAAPSVLGSYGYLKGKKATCFPGWEDKLTGAEHSDVPVVTDGQVITGRSMAAAIDFSLALIVRLAGKETADRVAASIVTY